MTGKVIKVRRVPRYTIELGNLHEAWIRHDETIEREPETPQPESDPKKVSGRDRPTGTEGRTI
jgi:hypothetical protein